MYVEETPTFDLSYGLNTLSALSPSGPAKRPNAPEHSISLGFNRTLFLVRNQVRASPSSLQVAIVMAFSTSCIRLHPVKRLVMRLDYENVLSNRISKKP